MDCVFVLLKKLELSYLGIETLWGEESMHADLEFSVP